jgi:DNA-binding FadR family transcriptional regulator
MALGACLSHALGAGDLESVSLLVQDSLELRRSLLLEMIERAAPRLAGQNLDRSRALAQRAWTHRGDVETFLSEDRELIPGLLQEAALWASLWALNSLAETYLKAMSVLGSRFTVPTSYLPAMSTMIAALETGDGAEARRALDRYLDDLDRCIAGSLTAVQERRQRR